MRSARCDQPGTRQSLDRRDRCFAHAFDWDHAGADRVSVQVDGASTAQSSAAPKFRARHSEHVAEHPQQRRVAIDIDAVADAIDFDRERHRRQCFIALLGAV